MLELSQKILQKVSFDKMLFKKELMKSIRWVKPSEKTLLLMWCLTTFGQQYKDEIMDAFSKALN
jgi:hypothetical protein